MPPKDKRGRGGLLHTFLILALDVVWFQLYDQAAQISSMRRI
jgi:hypothetical protein